MSYELKKILRKKIFVLIIRADILKTIISNVVNQFRIPSLAVYFFVGIFLLSVSLNAKTLVVCESCQYKTIHSALNAANINDTLEVQGGIYKESPIHITKPVIMKGIGNPILDGENKEHVVDISSDHVSMDGFKIINSGVSDIHEFAGVHAENVKDCHFKNNILENVTYGFYFAKVENFTLDNNITIGNAKNEVSGGNGIHLWSCNHFSIHNNKISKHRDGIYLEFSTDLLIENNLAEESLRYGLHFMFSSGNKFYRNHFTHNSTGVAIMFSKYIDVKENFFEKSKDENSYGILLKDITDSDFTNNVFQENTIGISADNASRNKFNGNQFTQNGWAVNMMGNSEYNHFSGNNFIGNVFNLSTNTRENLNVYERNYWDDYAGFDLNRDGIGDKPYLPVKLFSYWVNIYPFLMVLFQSPVIEFLEIAERAFPVMSPVNLKDESPKMKKIAL